ncbi:MAG: glycosyltransferase family 4 protein [Bacteroides sp.]|nr:glycosyltransferase family 4 protein [Bacteroides sp.]MCM1413246.1 glycosyltransferase family 4 protein [Bacteroides sp.]MCM1471444.1 glycosyltransferase family 4 protein [Bacteroides sp.]
MQHTVVSAVNIRKGGTLTILRSCLEYLSAEAMAGRMRVTALVHDRSLCNYPGIDYIEMPSCTRSWLRRLWAEYVTMHRLSKRLNADLWLSLHDTTPRVKARRQAVYCQTSFPFLRCHLRDLRMDYKIPLFAMLTRYAYRINVHRNKHLIVQQHWLRTGLSRMLGVDPDRFIVAPPEHPAVPSNIIPRRFDLPTFFFASTPDVHKNFETVAEAARLLERQLGTDSFRVVFTVAGTENRYARWLLNRYADVSSIRWEGLMDRPTLYATYAGADCFIFPSRIETWGLPISEAKTYGHPMILADLPYARETASGAPAVAFTDPLDAQAMARLMQAVVEGDLSDFKPYNTNHQHTEAASWQAIFDQL